MQKSEKEILQESINNMIDSMTRVAAERDLQREIIKGVKENTAVSPKVFRKMAKVAFAANFSEEVAVHEEFEELYKELMNVTE